MSVPARPIAGHPSLLRRWWAGLPEVDQGLIGAAACVLAVVLIAMVVVFARMG